MQPSSLRTRLRAIPPERARLQTDLIAALNGRDIDDLHTTARLAGERDRRAVTAWIDFLTPSGPVALAPLLVDGTLARMTAANQQPDGAAAAALLGRIEPLVAALEVALGVALQPTGLSRAIQHDERLLLRIDAAAGAAGIRHRLVVAVPADLPVSPLPLPARIPPLVAGLRLKWRGRIAGPVIAPARLAALAHGDLILLGLGVIAVTLTIPGRNDGLRASIDWGDGGLVVSDGTAEGETVLNMTNDPAGAGGAERADWQALNLPTIIEFDGAGLTAAELGTIGKGSVLPLPVQGGTLAVRVRAGGTLVAEGELVAVGEGFGVLVTSVRTAPAD